VLLAIALNPLAPGSVKNARKMVSVVMIAETARGVLQLMSIADVQWLPRNAVSLPATQREISIIVERR
jgi:hypothetical protein